MTGLWVTWALGVELSEALEVVHGQVVAQQVSNLRRKGAMSAVFHRCRVYSQITYNVLQSTSVTIGEDESIPVDPRLALGGSLEESAGGDQAYEVVA